VNIFGVRKGVTLLGYTVLRLIREEAAADYLLDFATLH
jgi:hypothetical protein